MLRGFYKNDSEKPKLEVRLRPQVPREAFEPDGDPYVLRGRQENLERITYGWQDLPQWVTTVIGGPGQGKSTLVRALMRMADERQLLPVTLDPLRMDEVEHCVTQTYQAMINHRERTARQQPAAVRTTPEQWRYPHDADELLAENHYLMPEGLTASVTTRGWRGVVMLADDAHAITVAPNPEKFHHIEGMIHSYDEPLNHRRYQQGPTPTCLIVVGLASITSVRYRSGLSHVMDQNDVRLAELDAATATAILRDHLDVQDADGTRPASVPEAMVTHLADRYRPSMHDTAAAGHYLQAAAMVASRAGTATVADDALDQIEAEVRIAQNADCRRRLAELTVLERHILMALSQAAADRDNRISSDHRLVDLAHAVATRVMERDPQPDDTLVNPSARTDPKGYTDNTDHGFLINRMVNRGVFDELEILCPPLPLYWDHDNHSQRDFNFIAPAALVPWVERYRQEELAKAAPDDRWRWDWSEAIAASLRPASEYPVEPWPADLDLEPPGEVAPWPGGDA